MLSGVDHAAAGVDAETGKTVLLAQDGLHHAEIAHHIGLRFGHELHIAVLNGLRRGGGQREARDVDRTGPDARGLEMIGHLRGERTVVHNHHPGVGVTPELSGDDRCAEDGVLVDFRRDFLIIDGHARLLQHVDDRLRAPSAIGKPLQAPYERAVALVQLRAAEHFLGQRLALRIIVRTDVAESLGPVARLRLGQRRVHGRDHDALPDRRVDERAEGGVAGMAHDDDAVGARRNRVAEIGQHGFRVPVGIQQAEIAAHVGGGRLGPVLHDGAVAVAHGTARVEPDRHAFARLGGRRRAQQGQSHQTGHQQTFHSHSLSSFPRRIREGPRHPQRKHRCAAQAMILSGRTAWRGDGKERSGRGRARPFRRPRLERSPCVPATF